MAPFDGDVTQFDTAVRQGAPPGAFVVPAKLPPGAEGLRVLAEVLRHPEVWPKTHRWNFCVPFYETECETAGCAISVACLMWPHQFKGIIAAYVELKKGGAEYIFMPSTKGALETYGKRMEDITPTDVADAIDRHLAAGAALDRAERLLAERGA